MAPSWNATQNAIWSTIWNAKVSNTFLSNAYISGVYMYLLTLVYKNISKSQRNR